MHKTKVQNEKLITSTKRTKHMPTDVAMEMCKHKLCCRPIKEFIEFSLKEVGTVNKILCPIPIKRL